MPKNPNIINSLDISSVNLSDDEETQPPKPSEPIPSKPSEPKPSESPPKPSEPIPILRTIPDIRTYNKKIKAIMRDFSYKMRKMLYSECDKNIIVDFHNSEKEDTYDQLYIIESEMNNYDLEIDDTIKKYIDSIFDNEKEKIIDILN